LLSATIAIILLAGAIPSVSAREIHLGGTNAAPGAPPPAKLAPNIVELPTIIAAIRREDGGWRHIRIDAWLAPQDIATARAMDDKKTSIVMRSQNTLPGKRGFDALKSAHDGNQVAKEVIHAAAAQTLGHPWTGDVLIRNILVY
jgi:hypothetical protein